MASRTHRLHAAALCLAWIGLTGCRDQPPAATGSTRLVRIDELSEAERRFGHSPQRNRAVTYQPDVVLVENGAEAVRSAEPDGLTWTIDPGAKGVGDIEPGKVLLLTSRAAGRVLGVERTGEGLRVILGPVEITDVIKEGSFNLDQPVDLEQSLQFNYPEVFDPVIPVEPIIASTGRPFATLASFRSAPPVPAAAGRFRLEPLVGRNGIGVRIRSTEGGVLFLGEAVLYLGAPSLKFDLDIKGGKITTAEMELRGVAGLSMTFEAGRPTPSDPNINEVRYSPVEFSLPVNGMGVPFAVTFHQRFMLKTAFTSSGAVKARLYYKLAGGVSAGYRDGNWRVGGPTSVTGIMNLDTMLVSTTGAALGVTGMVMTHQASVMVGIGAFGFVTGPYGYVNSSVAVTRGSDAGILTGPMACRQGTISMGVGAGVGYQMPEPVSGAINALLRALNIKHRVEPSGGLQTDPMIIVNIARKYPGIEACG